jgi:hypothetical protein
MLKDLKELLDEDDDLYPSPEDGGRRKYYLIGGIAGGALLLIILCIGVYAIFLSPGGDDQARVTPTSTTAMTEIAGIEVAATETPESTDTPTLPPPTETPDIIPSPTPTPSEVATNTPTQAEATVTTAVPLEPTTTPSLIFLENFEGSGGIWPTQELENYEYGIADGQFRMKVNAPYIEPWTVRERVFEDVRLETDMMIPSSSQPGYAGLICRFQDGFNFYAAIINADGEFSIVRRTGNQLIELAGPQTSDLVSAQGSANRLRLDCIGDQFGFYINGVRLLDGFDNRYPDGQVGFVGGTLDSSGFEVLFDNFVIARP